MADPNYFELFEMPVQLRVDAAALRRSFLQLSRAHHPDRHALDDEAAQEAALQASSKLNKAYKTLSNPMELIRYVLELKGLMPEGEKMTLPPEFLMEMMEWNEALGDAETEEEKQKIYQQLEQYEQELYASVAGILEGTDGGEPERDALFRVRDYYFKKKYLDRLRHQTGQML